MQIKDAFQTIVAIVGFVAIYLLFGVFYGAITGRLGIWGILIAVAIWIIGYISNELGKDKKR